MIAFLKRVELRPIEWLGLLFVAALVFVWPIRGTIALRNVLLVVALVTWITLWLRTRDSKPRLPGLKSPLLWYGVLTAWLLVGAFLVSVDTPWSLQELKSQWLRSAMAGVLGFLLAAWAIRPRFDSDRGRLCLLVLAFPIVLQILITLGDTVWLWVHQGYMPERIARLTGGKLGMSVNVNFLFALIVADVLVRLRGATPLLPASNGQLLLLGVAGLACTYVIGARNGTFCLALLVVGAIWIHFGSSKRGHRELAWIAMIALAIAGIGYASFKSDYRWQTFEESAVLAWDTESNRAWLDRNAYPLPKLHDGRTVEVSSYLRIAWLKEGTKTLLEHPLGMGFGRNAMGRAFHEKHGLGLGGHGDNGLIDFSLAAGIPGLVLAVGLLASLMLLGWRHHKMSGSAFGLAMALVIATYAMRSLLDSTTRDNYLEQFLFTAALFATLNVDAREIVTDGSLSRMEHQEA